MSVKLWVLIIVLLVAVAIVKAQPSGYVDEWQDCVEDCYTDMECYLCDAEYGGLGE